MTETNTDFNILSNIIKNINIIKDNISKEERELGNYELDLQEIEEEIILHKEKQGIIQQEINSITSKNNLLQEKYLRNNKIKEEIESKYKILYEDLNNI